MPATDLNTGNSGVWRVVVVYNDGTLTGDEGSWVPVELTDDDHDNTWEGSQAFSGTDRVTYVIQAVDNRGNVTWLDYVPAEMPASGVDPEYPNPVDVHLIAGAVADLGVTLGDQPDPVVGAQPFIYTIDVTNHGPSPASTLSVEQTLPVGVAFSSAGGTGWVCGEAGGVVSCSRDSLADAASASITVVVIAPATSGVLGSSVTASATQTDDNPTDNTASAETTVNGLLVSDLSVIKDDGGLTPGWGESFVYTITVTNDGPDAVTGATVTDTFPAGLYGIAWTCVASPGSSCTASVESRS